MCALDGGLLMANRFCAFGSCGAIELPKIAHTIHHSTISAPTMKSGERTSSRNSSRRTSLRPADSAAADSTGTVADAHSAASNRIRGLSSENSTSAAIVTTMYTTPIVRTHASSIGKSFCWPPW